MLKIVGSPEAYLHVNSSLKVKTNTTPALKIKSIYFLNDTIFFGTIYCPWVFKLEIWNLGTYNGPIICKERSIGNANLINF